MAIREVLWDSGRLKHSQLPERQDYQLQVLTAGWSVAPSAITTSFVDSAIGAVGGAGLAAAVGVGVAFSCCCIATWYA